MDLGAIFILILVLVFILIFVTRPFFVRQRGHPMEKMEKSRKLSSLLAERERLLTAILELDSDQALDKIPAGYYSNQRVELLQRGAEAGKSIWPSAVSYPCMAVAKVLSAACRHDSSPSADVASARHAFDALTNVEVGVRRAS